MKRWLAIAVAALLAVSFTTPSAIAQTDGSLSQVVKFKVDPPDMADWMQALGMITEAARMSNLDEQFGWSFFEADPFEFVMVANVEAMSDFDDPQAWMRQFEGTAGQPLLQEAFGILSNVRYRMTTSRVEERVSDWSYQTDFDMESVTGASVIEVWIRAGHEEAFEEVLMDYLGFVKEMGYVYPIAGHRPRIGGTGEHTFVTFIDLQENYYGKNALYRIAQARGAGEQLQELMMRFAEHMLDAETYDVSWLSEMSYPGPGSE
jgi:hypothetical protein